MSKEDLPAKLQEDFISVTELIGNCDYPVRDPGPCDFNPHKIPDIPEKKVGRSVVYSKQAIDYFQRTVDVM